MVLVFVLVAGLELIVLQEVALTTAMVMESALMASAYAIMDTKAKTVNSVKVVMNVATSTVTV